MPWYTYRTGDAINGKANIGKANIVGYDTQFGGLSCDTRAAAERLIHKDAAPGEIGYWDGVAEITFHPIDRRPLAERVWDDVISDEDKEVIELLAQQDRMVKACRWLRDINVNGTEASRDKSSPRMMSLRLAADIYKYVRARATW